MTAGEVRQQGCVNPPERVPGPTARQTSISKRQRHLSAAGLPKVRFHDLRHACASLLLADGMSPVEVAAQLGHETVTTTLTVYAHTLPHQARESADRMDRLLAVATGT